MSDDMEAKGRIKKPEGWRPGDWIGKYLKFPYLDSVVLITSYARDMERCWDVIEIGGSHHGRPGQFATQHILEQGEFVECEIKVLDDEPPRLRGVPIVAGGRDD